MGGAQVQSLTLTPLKHFGPLKGGGGRGGGPKITPFFEPPWCPGNIHTHAPCAAISGSTFLGVPNRGMKSKVAT